MTSAGKAYVLQRLADAPTLTALRTVWESIAHEYQKDPEIQALKNKLKQGFEQ